MSSADQHAIGVIRWEPLFISVSSSWAHNRRRDSDHWCPRVTPLMPAITASQTTTTIFFQPQATPASHQLHTSHNGWGIQTLFRVGGNESSVPEVEAVEDTLADSADKLTKTVLQSLRIPAKTRPYRPTHLKWPPSFKRLTRATPSI